MEETQEKCTKDAQALDSTSEQCLKNNHGEESEENGLDKLVFKHNDSVKLKSYQKLQKKQQSRRSHKKVNHVVEGDNVDKHPKCQANATEFQTNKKDANDNKEDSDASIHAKKVHYGGETRVRSLSGVEEESSDDGCDVEVS